MINEAKHNEKADRCDDDDGECSEKLSREENLLEIFQSFGSRNEIN